MLVAVTVIDPVEAGAVNNPLESIVPPLAFHVTVELKLPVPLIVAVHWEVAFVAIVDGLQATPTEEIVGAGAFTVIAAVPDLLVSCVLVAVTITDPAEAGAVNNPLPLIDPPLAIHVTLELYVPVPCTVALHWDVALGATVEGLQLTDTAEIVGGVVCVATVIIAAPDLLVSCVLVAVTVTDPAEPGAVNNPLPLIVPPLAVQVTAEPKLPVPCTVALHCEVAPGAIVEGLHATDTEEIVGGLGAIATVTVAVPDLLESSVLVAVTVTVAAELGAVRSPLALIDPLLAVHVTIEL